MDAGVTLPSSKKQDLTEHHQMDIISKLPDHILHHMLSFLSTKDVAQTSVLSRRWQVLWASVANIDLEDRNHPEVSRGNFIEFIDQVLTFHDASIIKRLRLKLYLPATFPRLSLWIRIALNHNVEELDLFLGREQQYPLPCLLFISHSLTLLKISAQLTLKCPPSTYFINFKKLHLSYVTLSDDGSIQRLFANCPVLEELVLERCYWEHVQSVTISIPTLKILSIVVSGCTEPACLINILSSNITDLHCETDLTVNLCICDLPSLDRAHVEIPSPEEVMDGIAYRAQRLFSSICNVERLEVTHDVLWSIMILADLWDHVPTFHKLTQLELGSDTPPDDFSVYIHLMNFLRKTLNLENLNIFETSYENGDMSLALEGYIGTLENVPSCFGSSLKIFSISYFEGRPEELTLVKFVLKTAVNLQRMTIFCNGDLARAENKQILLKNRLNKLKVSESCVIELHEDW